MYYVKWIVLLILFIQTATAFDYYHEPSVTIISLFDYAAYPNDSLFGYSITYQSETRSLVISAPRADSTGQIFIYNIKEDKLTKAQFDVQRETNTTTDFWLGATVKAGPSFFTTCAPRYEKYYEGNIEKELSFGQCFIKPMSQDMQLMQPMTKDQRKLGTVNIDHTMDSFGWSIDITPHNNILIGSPAMFSGRVIEYRNRSDSPMLILPPGMENNTKQNLSSFNFGYSIASGNFFSDLNNEVSYAISTPYGVDGVGQVMFYSEDRKYIGSLKDNDSGLGTMFGAALCAVKLDGKRSSLFVGAPAYISDGDSGDDLGAVHIYTPNDTTLSRKLTIRGQQFGGRFGNAIVNIGDIDSDRKDDVAIAAPYEDDGRGAVYIYTAKNILTSGKEISYSQRIQHASFRSFGLSVTALQDYDDNGCNELAIGAPESNAVTIYKCFTSVELKVFTELPNLQIRTNAQRGIISFLSCRNILYPKKLKRITATVSFKISLTHPTATFNESKSKVFVYNEALRDKSDTISSCKTVWVLTPLDKYIELNAIQILVTAKLENDPRLQKKFNPESVILSEISSLSALNTIWATGCKTTICAPILLTKIFTKMANPYTIGSSDVENFSITVTNRGETAYNMCVRVRVSGVRVFQAPGCRLENDENLVCEPRNPIRNNETWNTDNIMLETKSLTSKDRNVFIHIDTYDHCETKSKKSTEKVIDLITDTRGLTLMREAIPDEIVRIPSSNVETEISHLYSIINNGMTNWDNIKSRIVQNSTFVQIKNPIGIVKKSEKLGEHTFNLETQGATCDDSVCDIGDIRRNEIIYIMVTLQILPMPVDLFDVDKNVTVTSYFHLQLNYETVTKSVSSTLVKIEAPKVAIWIYICAGVLALLIILILIVIFYKCGFLQRKNKEKLKSLKENVKRQSMRRSELRESMRASQSKGKKDWDRLVNESGDRSKYDETKSDTEENAE